MTTTPKLPRFELHPLCAMYAPIEGQEFEDLCDDIKRNGLRAMIVLHQGKILDGQNRYRACHATETSITTWDYNGSDPAGFVRSVNDRRRHETAAQRAMRESMRMEWAQKHTPESQVIVSQAERATSAGVSERTQRDADAVAAASPALAKKVAAGKITLPEAVAKVRHPRQPATLPVQQEQPDSPDQAEIMGEQEKLIAQQQAEIASLSETDRGVELVKVNEMLRHAVREKDAEIMKYGELQKEADKLRRFRTKVVELTKATSPNDALEILKKKFKRS